MGAESEHPLCNKAEQRGFEDEASERIRRSHAQCKKNQPILGIVAGLNRVIPGVERLNQRTNKAGEQSKRGNYSERPMWHGFEYSAAGSQDGKRGLPTRPSKPDIFLRQIAGSDGDSNPRPPA